MTPDPLEMLDWQPIETAPWQVVVLVKNALMNKPVRATRGFVHNGKVHPDKNFFTSVYTPDRFFPTPSGRLVCPDVWAPLPPESPSMTPETVDDLTRATRSTDA